MPSCHLSKQHCHGAMSSTKEVHSATLLAGYFPCLHQFVHNCNALHARRALGMSACILHLCTPDRGCKLTLCQPVSSTQGWSLKTANSNDSKQQQKQQQQTAGQLHGGQLHEGLFYEIESKCNVIRSEPAFTLQTRLHACIVYLAAYAHPTVIHAA